MTKGPISRMSESDMDALVRDIVGGAAFFTTDGAEIGEAFGLILSVIVPDWDEPYIESFGGAWAPWSSAFPMASNGVPMFSVMHAVHRDDARLIVNAVARLENGA